MREEIDRRAPALAPEQATAVARVAAGRLDRVERLLDADGSRRRAEVLAVARSVYADPAFDPAAAAQAVLALAAERGASARAEAEQSLVGRELPEREAEQHVKRVERGAERDEILLALEELAAWYRDLVVVAAGAERAVVHYDRLDELPQDAGLDRRLGAERAAEAVREAWRSFEEFNVSPSLALEALFVRLRRELGGCRPRPARPDARALRHEPSRPDLGDVRLADGRGNRRDPDDDVSPGGALRQRERGRPRQRPDWARPGWKGPVRLSPTWICAEEPPPSVPTTTRETGCRRPVSSTSPTPFLKKPFV